MSRNDLITAIINLYDENDRLEEHKEYYKNEKKRLGKLFYITKEENIKLQQRIDKAIEYIKTCNPDVDLNSMFLNESYISNYGATELLNILEGKSDE